ncbi:MAG: recombinase family protein [Oscillochloridaceae bacterium umkhey_bin13]
MALVGYARVSSVGQSLEVQLEKLKHCDKLYQEQRSATGKRPRLSACLEYVREGDTLVVTRLDRLARSTLHLCQIAEELRRKGVHLQVLDQQIHTNDATSQLLFHMLGAIAQFETELRAERQMDGIQLAKARGVVFGRSKQLTPEQVAELQERRQQGVLIRTLMQDYQISKATVYRYLGMRNEKEET